MKWSALIFIAFVTMRVAAQDTKVADLIKAACGASGKDFKVTNRSPAGEATPQPGKAQVSILEVQDRVAICLANCGSTVKVGLDGQWVGATRGTSHLNLQVDPGQHHLCVAWQSKLSGLRKHRQLARFTVKSGDTLYFRVHLVPPTETTISVFDFEAINPDEGKLLAASSPLSSW